MHGIIKSYGLKDQAKVLYKSKKFNKIKLTKIASFHTMTSLKKLVLAKFWYRIKEEHPQLPKMLLK
jgi:hypothetical protein